MHHAATDGESLRNFFDGAFASDHIPVFFGVTMANILVGEVPKLSYFYYC
jgi:hypothetical protein